MYDFVQRQVVERLTNKSLQVAEDQQPPKSSNLKDRKGDRTNDGQQVSPSWEQVGLL